VLTALLTPRYFLRFLGVGEEWRKSPIKSRRKVDGMKRILCDVRAERSTSTPLVRPDVAKNSIEGNRRQRPLVMGIAWAVRAEKAGKKS
jgi:hypothetical protein